MGLSNKTTPGPGSAFFSPPSHDRLRLLPGRLGGRGPADAAGLGGAVAHEGRRRGRFHLGGGAGAAGSLLRPAGRRRSAAENAGGGDGQRLVVPAGRPHPVQPADRQAGRRALPAVARPLARAHPTQILRFLPGAGTVDGHVRHTISHRHADPGTTTAISARRRHLNLAAGGVGRDAGRPATGGLEGRSDQPGADLPGRAVALFPPSQLFLRVAALVELPAAGLGFAGVVADPARSGADAVHPAQGHRHSLHRTAGADQSRRRLPCLPARHQRVRSLVPQIKEAS